MQAELSKSIYVVLSLGIWLGLWGMLWSMWDRRAFAPAVLMAIGFVSGVILEIIT